MEKTIYKGDGSGVEVIESSNRNQSGSVWGGAAGGFVGGGVLGYILGQNTGNKNRNCGGNYNGCGDCDSVPVTRFELRQSELLEAEQAKVAELNAKLYTNDAATSVFERAAAYTREQLAPVKENLTDLTKGFIVLDKQQAVDAAISAERIACLKSDLVSFKGQTAEEFHETRAWVRNNFIEQPTVKVRCGTPGFCAGCASAEAPTTPAAK